MFISMNLTGAKELDKKLLALQTKVARKVVKKAVRTSLKPELASSKSNAKSMVSGEMGALLSKNLQLKVFKKQKKGSYGMSVKMKSDVDEFVHTSKSGGKSYIPAAIEYGHKTQDGGFVQAIPFMRAAADPWMKVGIALFGKEVKKGIKEVTRGR